MSLAKDKPYYAEPSKADLPNIIEELQSLGNEQRRSLKSSYRVPIAYLLKWQFQPERRSRSWVLTIGRERDKIEDREENKGRFAAKRRY